MPTLQYSRFRLSVVTKVFVRTVLVFFPLLLLLLLLLRWWSLLLALLGFTFCLCLALLLPQRFKVLRVWQLSHRRPQVKLARLGSKTAHTHRSHTENKVRVLSGSRCGLERVDVLLTKYFVLGRDSLFYFSRLHK